MRKVLSLLACLSLVAIPQLAQADLPNLSTSQTLSASGDVALLLSGQGTCSVTLTGTWTGTASFLVSNDGINTIGVNSVAPNASNSVTSATTNGTWVFSSAGMKKADINFAWTSGSANITLTCGPGGGATGSVSAVSVPSGPAGTPNTSVLSVQGITNGTAIQVQGLGTTGTPSGGIQTVQGVTGGTALPTTTGNALGATQPTLCNKSINVNLQTAATTQIIAASGVTSIVVCGFLLQSNGVLTAQIVSADSGGSCANAVTGSTGTGTGPLPLAGPGIGAAVANSSGLLFLPSGKALCIVTTTATSGTQNVSGFITYAQG